VGLGGLHKPETDHDLKLCQLEVKGPERKDKPIPHASVMIFI